MEPDDLSDISALLDDYAYGVDTKDWDLVASVFSEDATLDYSAFGGPNGPAPDVVAWMAASIAAFAVTQHHVTNRRIRVDGDGATSTAELFAPMGMGEGKKLKLLFSGGRYVDSFVRTKNGWKISSRRCENGWLGTGPDISMLS